MGRVEELERNTERGRDGRWKRMRDGEECKDRKETEVMVEGEGQA